MVNSHDGIFDIVDMREHWLLCHIVRRLNKKMFCFPSNNTLMEDTGWSMDTLQKVKKSLIRKGLISVEARFNEIDRQSTNVYRVETDLIGVFVPGKGLSYPPKNQVWQGEELGTREVPKKPVTEVLTREEVLNEDSKKESSGMSDNTSYGKNPKLTKQKKEANPVFVACVDFWLKEFHPGWGFKAVDGKSLKTLIDSMRNYSVKKNGFNPGDDQLVNFFKHFCNELPDFYRSQDLRVLASKFDSIIEQIKNGRRKSVTSPASAASVIRGL